MQMALCSAPIAAALSILVRAGTVTADTHVFDLTVDTAGRWRESFEKRAAESWHARVLKSALST